MSYVRRTLAVTGLFLLTSGFSFLQGCASEFQTAEEASPASQADPGEAGDVAAGAEERLSEQETRTDASGSTTPDLLGAWQCMTRMQRMEDPMFTFRLEPNGRWTELTFGPAHRKEASYTHREGLLRLESPSGGALYTFSHVPAAADAKERLVEKVPEEDLYKAQVCYRYEGSLAQ